MKNKLAITGALLCLLGFGSASADQLIIGDMGLESLPPQDSRKIMGTWLMKDMGCTRSIEAAQDRLFMVARCKGIRAADKGLLLAKVSDSVYQSKTNNWSYEIATDGVLIMRNRRGDVVTVGQPHSDLWP